MRACRKVTRPLGRTRKGGQLCRTSRSTPPLHRRPLRLQRICGGHALGFRCAATSRLRAEPCLKGHGRRHGPDSAFRRAARLPGSRRRSDGSVSVPLGARRPRRSSGSMHRVRSLVAAGDQTRRTQCPQSSPPVSSPLPVIASAPYVTGLTHMRLPGVDVTRSPIDGPAAARAVTVSSWQSGCPLGLPRPLVGLGVSPAGTGRHRTSPASRTCACQVRHPLSVRRTG